MKNWLSIQNLTPEKAVINITGIIGGTEKQDTKTEQVYKDLIDILNLSEKKEINTIIVNVGKTPGGSVVHGYLMYQLLTNCGKTIITNGRENIGSAGTYPFLSGSIRNIERPENFKFHIHRLSGTIQGNSDDLEKALPIIKNNLLDTEQKIINFYSTITKKSEDEIKNLMFENDGDGRDLTAQECIDYGFATNIINLNNKKMNFKNLFIQLCNFLGIDISKLNTEKIENVTEFQNLVKETGKDYETIFFELTNKITENIATISELENDNLELKTKVDSFKPEKHKEIEVNLTNFVEMFNKVAEKDGKIIELTNQIKEYADLKTELKVETVEALKNLIQSSGKVNFQNRSQFKKEFEKDLASQINAGADAYKNSKIKK